MTSPGRPQHELAGGCRSIVFFSSFYPSLCSPASDDNVSLTCHNISHTFKRDGNLCMGDDLVTGIQYQHIIATEHKMQYKRLYQGARPMHDPGTPGCSHCTLTGSLTGLHRILSRPSYGHRLGACTCCISCSYPDLASCISIRCCTSVSFNRRS